ncbi:MAG: hypothetical protein J2P25_00935 [Nocardiopsaceae bacterium]|nr:hypothetical protein [Nocardiopsaceae bacterium]
MDPDLLTEPEQQLWKAFGRGELVDFADAGAGDPPVIRAEVVTALLLGAVEPETGAAAGIRLRGARITGSVDLKGGAVSWPAVFDGCRFDNGVGFVDSSVRTVRILDSELPVFNGARMRLDGILDLKGSVIAGGVRLDQARVSGQLRLREARVGTGTAIDVVAAEALSVEGSIDCAGMEARGKVLFQALRVSGVLDLSRVRLSCPGERALTLSYASIEGKLDCWGMRVAGEVRAINLQVAAQFGMSSARLHNPGGWAFFAGGLTVGGGAFFAQGFTAHGEFRLVGARLAQNLTIDDATFDNPGAVALNLEQASIGAVHGERLACRGQVSMPGATISGDVNLAGGKLEAGAGDALAALNAERAQIGGTLVMRDMKALGEVRLRSVQLGERLVLDDAELRNPPGRACRLTRARVAADVFCDGMVVEGQFRLPRAVIGGALTLLNVELRNPEAKAIDARSMQVQELQWRPKAVEGSVDLANAMIGVLRDKLDTWPEKVFLDGLTYQALDDDPLTPAGERLDWLDHNVDKDQPQPYEYLAAYYDSIGQPAQARAVRYAREKRRRRDKGPAIRTWSWLQDITVGYGYRPLRALGWLALLLLIGSVVFSVSPPPPLQPGQAPHFNGVVYTLDLMLPVVNLGQKFAFNPGGAEQWLSYFLMAAGWTLATTVAAGAARVLRRG